MSSPRRRGSALVIVTVLIVLLLALAASLTETSVSSLKTAKNRQEDVVLTLTTESLANTALAHLRAMTSLSSALNQATNDKLVVDITSDVRNRMKAANIDGAPLFNGLDVQVTWQFAGTVSVPDDGVIQNKNIYKVTAIAAEGGPAKYRNADGTTNRIDDINRYRRKRIEILVVPEYTSIVTQAMYSRQGFDFWGSATTDSWNSGDGLVSYAGAPTKGNKGDLTSNGSINVLKPGSVQGQVNQNKNVPTPQIDFNPPGSATILPLGNASPGVLLSASNLPSGTYRCSAISLANKKQITLAPGAQVTIYVDSYVDINNNWTVTPDQQLTIIQNNFDTSKGGNGIKLNGNDQVGCPQRPAAFVWMTKYDGKLPDPANSNDPDFQFNGGAGFSGVLIAPQASFKLNGNFDLYGSVFADAFVKSNGNLAMHYDESLGSAKFAMAASLTIVGWHSSRVGVTE